MDICQLHYMLVTIRAYCSLLVAIHMIQPLKEGAIRSSQEMQTYDPETVL